MDLGLSEEQFWGLTMRQYEWLVKRYNEKQKTRAYELGSILATIHNSLRFSDKDPVVKAEDFIKNHKPSPEQRDSKIINAFRWMKNN